jgi:hypothetical protein
MEHVRPSRVAFAAAYVVLVLGLFFALGGLAYAQGPSSARDQYGTKVKGVTVTEEAQQPQVAEEESGLPNTGLSLLGTVVVGGALVGVGVALRRRERGDN